MITSSIGTKLSLLLPNHNKLLAEIIKQATPEQLTHLQESKDLKTFLGSLLRETLTNTKSDTVLLEILKNNPSFKNMGNFTDNLKTLLAALKEDPTLTPKLSKLDTFSQPIQNMNLPLLKEKIANSGIFMESKIAALEESPQQLEESLGRDVKSNLLTLSKELSSMDLHNNDTLQTQIDQLVTHIDYQQLLSHLSNSQSLYFPFQWDQLKEGNIAFKKAKGKKFYCEINLTLKDYGKIDLLMGLYEENQLEIKVYTEQSVLKTLILEHLETLRTLFIDAGITLRIFRIHEFKEIITPSSTAYGSDSTDSQYGFEAIV